MIKVTNNTKQFFEYEQGEVIIYGAGNAGYWIGYYMNKCNMEYECYVDKNSGILAHTFNNHPIYSTEYLKDNAATKIRLIVSPAVYKEILAELLWMDHLCELNIICLIPQYKDTVFGEDKYDINKLLSYFRRKLFQGDTPTIISNTCIAGIIYDMLGTPLLSPTINVGIDAGDYIKLCNNFKFYIKNKVEIIGWEREYSDTHQIMECIVGRLADIKIKFAHVDSVNGIVERWSMMCSYINWNRIIYIMIAQRWSTPAIPYELIEKFDRLRDEHLFIDTYSSFGYGGGMNNVYIPEHYFSKRSSAIENSFDILGWFNMSLSEKNGR